jgi:mono/diheme cytochrome c family protein
MQRNGATALLIVVLMGMPGRSFAQDQAQIDRGAQVYATQKCILCHAIGGKGNLKGPLDAVGTKLTAEEIRAWIVNPVEMTAKTRAERQPAMRASPNLSKEDLDALVAYMVSLKKN